LGGDFSRDPKPAWLIRSQAKTNVAIGTNKSTYRVSLSFAI